jgi:hypothetical protein
MITLKHAALAAVAASFTIAAPVLADEMKPGMMVMATADGKVMTMPMPSKDMVDAMRKNAQEMGTDMALFVWGSKVYLVKNEKMPDGKMSFDYWGLHGTR